MQENELTLVLEVSQLILGVSRFGLRKKRGEAYMHDKIKEILGWLGCGL